MDRDTVVRNHVLELTFTAADSYADAFNDVVLDAKVTAPDGEVTVYPAFWAGGLSWRLRVSSEKTGTHSYTTICSNTADTGLHGVAGEFNVISNEGDKTLYKHGRHRIGENGRHISQADGTPFFWLADTWWMALVSRVDLKDFEMLVKDRAAKGFTVIQLCAGLFPAFRDDHIWDERAANEGGFPWEQGFAAINPGYFDHADKRIEMLIENGIVPCIFGAWGEFLDRMGVDKMKAHWRYLVARWGAYPVIWSLCGEALLFYEEVDGKIISERKKGWTEVCRFIKDFDPYKRLVTVHPTDPHDSRSMLDEEDIVDIDMLQTGHLFTAIDTTVETVKACIAKQPPMPVINGEVCYEGILGTSWQDIQRFCFWSAVLSGAAGHTYGTVTMHVFQSKEERYVHDNDVFLVDGCWEEDYKLPGSHQVGLGRKFMERYPWWDFERRTESVMSDEEAMYSFAMGITGSVWVFYLPSLGMDKRYQYYCCYGRSWGDYKKVYIQIEPDADYFAFFFNPRTGEDFFAGDVVPDKDGAWLIPQKLTGEDWLLVLQSKTY